MFRADCALWLVLAFVPLGDLRGQPPPQTPAPNPPEQLPPAGSLPLDQPERPDRLDRPDRPPRAIDGFDGGDGFSGGRTGGLGGLGGSGLNGPAVLALTDRATWYPAQRVVGQAAELGFVKESLGITVPLYRDGPNTLAFTTSVGATIFSTDAFLPDGSRRFPDTIWNIRFGTNYTHLFANDWLGTLGVSLGSASDRPFEAWRDVSLGIHAMLRVPQGERNAWLFSLGYSPLGQLAFPVPGVAFQWVPNDWLRMNIGVPFQITVTPDADWQFTASYMLLTTIHTQLIYKVGPQLRLFTGFDWNNEGFQLADRVNTRDRFQYYEKRLGAGVKSNWGQFRFDVSGGYAFDRYFAEGGTFGTRNHLGLANGPYMALNGSYRW